MSRIPSTAAADIQQAFRDVWAAMPGLVTAQTVDLQRRRLMNAGDADDDRDLVTLQQVRGLLAATDGGATPVASPGTARVGAYSTRGAAAAHRWELFLASDRNYVGWVSTGTAWKYCSGVQAGTLSPDQKPTLTTDDAGYLFASTDFARVFRWSGSVWADAPGDPPRYMIAFFQVAPSTGWALCDGSSVTVSTSGGGTVGSVTIPNLTTGKRFLRSHTSVGATGGSATTHTHSVDVASTTSGAPSATSTVQSGAGATVASDTHTHTVDPGAVTSAGPSGSSGDDALPPYYEALPYMRL